MAEDDAGSTGGIVVRRAELRDVDAMVDARHDVASEGRWLAAEAPFDKAEVRDHVRDDLREADPSRAYFVAVTVPAETEREQLVGTIFVTFAPYGVVELGMLVLDGWRRRGIGSALLQAGVDWARDVGAHKVALQTWPHNEAAIALYRKHGFEEEGRLRRHYLRRNGERWDAIAMGLLLLDDD